MTVDARMLLLSKLERDACALVRLMLITSTNRTIDKTGGGVASDSALLVAAILDRLLDAQP